MIIFLKNTQLRVFLNTIFKLWNEDSVAQLALKIRPAFYFWKLQEARPHPPPPLQHTHTKQY